MYQRQLIEVDPQRIKLNPKNPRKHHGTDYIRLKESIKQIGMVQLPTVRVIPGGFYEVIDGHGRVSVAQEEHFEKIWVVSVGIIEEQEALVMLQSANTMRSFNFLAECKGLANLYRKGSTSAKLAEQFSSGESKIIAMVAIGHFPPQALGRIEEDIERSEKQAKIWSNTLLYGLLPLRELLPGKSASRGGQWFLLDDIYDYSEVNKAIEKVINEEITSADKMSEYVAKRKYEIYQARFDEDLRIRLEQELLEKKRELEAAKEKQLLDIEEKTQHRYEPEIATLKAQLSDLSKRHTKLINESAKRPEIVARLEEDLRTQIEAAEIEREQKLAKIQEEEQKQKELLEQNRQELVNARKIQQKDIEWELKKARHKMEADLKAYYEQKDQERQVKAENTIRGLLAYGVKSLGEVQQTMEHIISPGMLQGVKQLGGKQQDSLISQIRAMRETLDRAEEELTYSDIATKVESEFVNGYKA